jgi:hypothetical protein
VIELCETRPGGGLSGASGPVTRSTGAQCGLPSRPRDCHGGSGGDWWATAEQLADVAQRVAGVELTTAARMAVVEMTVDLLTLLTCWPNTSRQAHALAYLRTRRARMARHALWVL